MLSGILILSKDFKGAESMSIPLPECLEAVKNSLSSINITTLEQLTLIDEASLLKVPGMNPRTVKELQEVMEENGLSLLKEPLHSFATSFMVYGNLKCDNAPKRRIIRDYLIVWWMKDANQLKNFVTENVVLNKIGSEKVRGIEALINNYPPIEEVVMSLEIKEILTHGKEAAAHGTVTFKSGQQVHFSEFYTFDSHKKEARINFITNYTLHSN